MEDKDRIDADIKLAELTHAIREGRRHYEFKMKATAYVAALSVYPTKSQAFVTRAIHTGWIYRNLSAEEVERRCTSTPMKPKDCSPE